MTPLCQNRIEARQLNDAEPFFPLHAFVCGKCRLVQLGEYVAPDNIFSDYAYFSSYSDSWLRHARDYVEMAVDRMGIGAESFVVELASNDGYLLRNFVEREIPVLGIEPAANVAEVASKNGIPTKVRFFGRDTADEIIREHGHANLIIGNNVLAHVPDLNDFVAGMKRLLAPDGTITMEFPHLVQLVEQNQFDTIYHEHFSYFSYFTVEQVFAYHGLTLYDVEELPTHGGSLRIFARHAGEDGASRSAAARDLLSREMDWGVEDLATYLAFGDKVMETKRAMLDFLIAAKRDGKTIAGYGAPGKGNTLLNYCGIGTDFIDYTVDRSPHKQGTFTPGTHIPIYDPERIRQSRPDYLFILPWNLKAEIMAQMAHIREWGGRFVVPIPRVEVID
jgi:SAM-dependent methyltransferase